MDFREKSAFSRYSGISKKNRKKIFILPGLLVLLVFFSVTMHFFLSGCCREKIVNLKILQTDNLGGFMLPPKEISPIDDAMKYGGMAYLATKVKEYRKGIKEGQDYVLLLDGGDAFYGSPLSNATQGREMLACMNMLGYDALVLGNKEFYFGKSALMARASEASFPFLAANLAEEAEGGVKEFLHPFTIVEREGLRVAIIGIANPDTVKETDPELISGIKFEDEIEACRRALAKVRTRKPDCVIVLSHMGLGRAKKLVEKVIGIDLVIDGAGENEPGRLVTHEGVPVVTGTSSQNRAGLLGVITCRVNVSRNRILMPSYELVKISAATLAPDEAMMAKINEIEKNAAEALQRVVGEVEQEFEYSDNTENALGNLLTGIIRSAGKAQIGIVNSAAIRSGIPSGKITELKIQEILPFDNQIVSMTLTGNQIKEILEHGTTLKKGRMLYTDNLFYTVDMSQPVGSRVSNMRTAREPLMLTGTYRVATTNYLADGGDGFETFKKGEGRMVHMNWREAFKRYLAKYSPLRKEAFEPHVKWINREDAPND